jgi:hypothetical protein
MLTFVQLFKLSYVIVISLIEFSRCYFEEEFEDTKVVIRQLNDQKKKDRQLNDQKKKWKKTNNDHTYTEN